MQSPYVDGDTTLAANPLGQPNRLRRYRCHHPQVPAKLLRDMQEISFALPVSFEHQLSPRPESLGKGLERPAQNLHDTAFSIAAKLPRNAGCRHFPTALFFGQEVCVNVEMIQAKATRKGVRLETGICVKAQQSAASLGNTERGGILK